MLLQRISNSRGKKKNSFKKLMQAKIIVPQLISSMELEGVHIVLNK